MANTKSRDRREDSTSFCCQFIRVIVFGFYRFSLNKSKSQVLALYTRYTLMGYKNIGQIEIHILLRTKVVDRPTNIAIPSLKIAEIEGIDHFVLIFNSIFTEIEI